MTPNKKFVSHYMLNRAEYSDEWCSYWLAEEMRSNRYVWILEYFRGENNGDAENKLKIASAMQKMSIPAFVRIVDTFVDEESIYIITEIPKGHPLMPMIRFDEERFRQIGGNLLNALVLLQRNDLGLLSLSPDEIFLDEGGEIQLLVGKGWISKAQNENRQKELILFGEVLLKLIVSIRNPQQEISREFLQANVPSWILPLFEEILINQTMQRLEAASQYFQKKMLLSSGQSLTAEEKGQPILQKMTRYLILTGMAVAMFMVLTFRSDSLQHLSRFDVLRFHALGYLGSAELQYTLGKMYENGYGVEKNAAQSIEWYRKAAQNGNVHAQNDLGYFYYQGIGLPVDKKQALYWFTLAATNGDWLAKDNVVLLTAELSSVQTISNGSDEKIESPVKVEKITIDTVKPLEEEKTKIDTVNPPQPFFPTKLSTIVRDVTPKESELDYDKLHTYWLTNISETWVDGTRRNKGGIYGFYGEGYTNPIELIALDHDVRSFAVDANKNIYWADISTGEIIKADSRGKNKHAIVKGLTYPISIAVDDRHQRIYWSDWQKDLEPQKGFIGCSGLEGEWARVIVNNGLRSGGAIQIDEREEKIYVADIFGKKIVKMNTNGTNMKPIILTSQPNSICIDYENRQIYWSDLSSDSINVSGMDGLNKRLIFRNGNQFANPDALILDRYHQKLLFAQNVNGTDAIFSLHKNGSDLQQEYVNNGLYIQAIVQP